MKYYVYVSRTKVDMLYAQLPPDFLKGISAEVKVNVGVLSGTLKGTSDANDSNLLQPLHAVSEYIRKREYIGTINSPGTYISDTSSLKYGIVSEYASDIAFFGGVIGSNTLALIGSSTSLIGETERADANHSSYYYTLKFLNNAVNYGQTKGENPPFHSFTEAAWIALKALPPLTYNLEFLAKVLHREKGLIVGTPIYVAMVD